METVKTLSIKDIDLMKEVVEDCGYEYSYQSIKKYLKSDGNYIFGLILDNKIIAFAYGYKLLRVDLKKPMLYIHAVQVIKKYQNQGYGTKLLEYIIEYIKVNCSKGFLITTKDNMIACRLYEKLGAKTYNQNEVVYVFDEIKT